VEDAARTDAPLEEGGAVMDRYTRNVLVVEPYPVERERLTAALEGDGFEVELCSGPTAPDYTCIGARIGRCPLATGDCVVVLDMDLDSEGADLGTSAEELLAFYLGAEHRVVTLSSRPTGTDDDRLRQLRRHPETDDLLAAVWWSASPSAFGRPVSRGAWS
jgi:CheY-like chemotaxis protein